MLHAEAVVGGRRRLQRRLVRVEHQAVAAVADGVRVHWKPAFSARVATSWMCAGAETSRPMFLGSSL